VAHYVFVTARETLSALSKAEKKLYVVARSSRGEKGILVHFEMRHVSLII